MNQPDVTIIVSPRERFGSARRALETLYAVTAHPFRLVYVDGGAPRFLRKWLESEAQSKGFDLIGTGTYLSPDRARNLGFARADTKYAVFLDNDVIVAAGWLQALVKCAEETGAWFVGPLYCVDRPHHTIVHMAGGSAHVQETDGVRRFIEDHTHIRKPLPEVRHLLARGQTEQLEFHCMLARSEAMRRLGPLDARFCSVPEGQIDLCMRARAQGGTVWVDPDAVVTYDRPPPMAWHDVPYYLLRWSDSRGRKGLEHFRRQWNLAPDDPYFERQLQFMRWQRSHALQPLSNLLRGMSHWRRGRVVELAARALTEVMEIAVRPPVTGGW